MFLALEQVAGSRLRHILKPCVLVHPLLLFFAVFTRSISSGPCKFNHWVGEGYVAARNPRTASGVQSGSRQTIARAGSIPATSTGGAEGAVSSNVRKLLSMGFSYLRVMEAHSIFGDHISNMLCYLMETDGCSDGECVSRRKGKAAEWWVGHQMLGELQMCIPKALKFVISNVTSQDWNHNNSGN
jgi:hypothetical protein